MQNMPEISRSLDDSWNPFRERIETQLAIYLKPNGFVRIDSCPAELREAMQYSLLAGGKRMRPVLVLLACEACGGEIEAALPAACALEMVHTYSLIHDDLPAMDDDALRRGRPTNHKQFGEAMAILAGDALLTLAFEVLATETQPPQVAAACCAELASAAGAVGMVGGQVADLDAENSCQNPEFEPTLEQLESIHRRKTGRLLTCGLVMGARIAGAEHSTLVGLESFGKAVGLAFQIADDLLDVTGNPAKMGKGVRKDADHGKLTYPSLLGIDESRNRAEALIRQACDAIASLGSRGQRLEAAGPLCLGARPLMHFELLPHLKSPRDLQSLSNSQLQQVAAEIREALCHVVSNRAAHFASNLGVVELCVALHLVFDFTKDRLIWDTGHQIYPHKLVTGRFHEFSTIRQKGGLMGYPNPAESEYDLFMTGHAGASVSTVLGMKTADDLLFTDNRKSVAVIGDGALPSGIVFEAMNNAAGLKKDLLVILNDNKMGICPRVGGLASYLDKARIAPFYNGLKRDISWLLNKVPVVGESMAETLGQFKDAVKSFLHGGMLFEEMGFRYIGPVDGHDLMGLKKTLEMVKDVKGPVLLHVFTEKGHGFEPACEDPVKFHTPAPFKRENGNSVVTVKTSSSAAYTDMASGAIYQAMQRDDRVAVLTAAMCAGNKLGRIRDDFPNRFFDTGICEGHAVAFAGGMAKSGMKPIVDIYSTFLQRSFDHIFQEVALQNLPVVFCLDRAGLCGPDGPTHHGVFDNSYMRIFPNMTVMAPGDAADMGPMIDFALSHDGPTSIRYPKTNAESVERELAPMELGKAEVFHWGTDGVFLAFGTLFPTCVKAAAKLREDGLDVGVINARFIKPLDTGILIKALQETDFVITVEENTLTGGFGSAVLEAANQAGVKTDHLRCLGIPDQYIEHGERGELLADLGLDMHGLIATAKEMLSETRDQRSEVRDQIQADNLSSANHQ